MSSPGSLHGEDCRRTSLAFSTSSQHEAPDRMRRILSSLVPDANESDQGVNPRRRSSVLARVHSCSHLMHEHTRWQRASLPMSTVPDYQKTMHAWTLSQLNSRCSASKVRSETSSPHLSAQQAMLPSMVCADITQLTIDKAPVPPCNSPSPEHDQRRHATTMWIRRRPRSLTQPVPRAFAHSARERELVM